MDAGGSHDFGFAQFLHGDADGAGIDLHVGNRWDLMRLNMRTIVDAVLVEVILQARDV